MSVSLANEKKQLQVHRHITITKESLKEKAANTLRERF